MQQIYFYSVIFVMGVVCSITMMLFFTQISWNTRKIPNYLSDMHYLQVRDDYSVYSLASEQPKDVTDSQGGHKMGKKRNSVEGTKKKHFHFQAFYVNFNFICFLFCR